jgi:O-antigen/teichoic acid export membrane protein
VPLVGVLYDARYQAAGLVVVIMAMVQMPAVIGMTYDQSALAAGDSRSYFLLMALKAAVQTLAFFIGMETAGLWGALSAQAVALIAVHPAIAWLAHRNRAWDALHDAIFFALAAGFAALILWVNHATLGL